jgi:hypothetical protein
MFTDREFNAAALEARKAFESNEAKRTQESLNEALLAKQDAESDGAFDVEILDLYCLEN